MCVTSVVSLASVVDPPVFLRGVKTHLNDVLGKSLIFSGWRFGTSRYKTKSGAPKECLTLQYEEDGVTKILKTSSSVLLAQMKEFEKRCPGVHRFQATIVKEDDYIVFR